MVHSPIGAIHTVAATAALLFGAAIFLTRKGTLLHKRAGYCYVGAMAVTVVTAFCIYRLWGRLGPFHIAAVISAATLIAGFIPVARRRPADRWMQLHFEYMAWSYVGLAAAAVAEIAVRVPRAPFWPVVALGSAGVFVAGAILIARHRRRLFSKQPLR